MAKRVAVIGAGISGLAHADVVDQFLASPPPTPRLPVALAT